MSYPGYTIITFGKFQGRTFEDVYKNERGYCDWVMNLRTTNPDTIKLKKYIQWHGLRTADMNRQVTCKYCNGRFPGQVHLESHIEREHDTEKRRDEKWAIHVAHTQSK